MTKYRYFDFGVEGPEEPHDPVDTEPTPQEKFAHAMKLLRDYAAARDDAAFAIAHEALCNLFMDIYGIDKL